MQNSSWQFGEIPVQQKFSHFEDIEGDSMRFISKYCKAFKERKQFSFFVYTSS